MPLVSRGMKLGKLGGLGRPVIFWGLWVCLGLLFIELSLMAVTGNWLALMATLAAVGGVTAATYAKARPRRARQARLEWPPPNRHA